MELREIYYHEDGFLWLDCGSCTISVHRLPDTFCLAAGSCGNFICEHRNVFASKTEIYLITQLPIAFMEISISSSGEKCYWVWVFHNGFYYVVKFLEKPTPDEVLKVVNLISFERSGDHG